MISSSDNINETILNIKARFLCSCIATWMGIFCQQSVSIAIRTFENIITDQGIPQEQLTLPNDTLARITISKIGLSDFFHEEDQLISSYRNYTTGKHFFFLSPNDWTPLHSAARYGRPACTRLLLAHGADPERTAKIFWGFKIRNALQLAQLG